MKLVLPIHVAVLDDHAVVRAGYEREILSDSRLELAGVYADSAALLNALRQGVRIDILLLDYALSHVDMDGVLLISMLRDRYRGMRILVASAHDTPATVSLVLRNGAQGFLSKAQSMRELVPALKEVAAGRRYVPEALQGKLPHIAAAGEPGDLPAPGADSMAMLDLLSKREREVMRCLLDGLTVGDIAQKYSRSVKTISNQKQSAYRKLGIRTDVEVASYRERLLGR